MRRIKQAFGRADGEDWLVDVGISVMPFAGIAGLLTGLIDLKYDHSTDQGIRKVTSFTIAHLCWVLLVLLL